METFGPVRSLRVLAATLSGEVEALAVLATDARRAASALVTLEPERPFRPHLTVARARSAQGDRLLGRCQAALGQALEVREVALIRSETQATGAVHTELARWTLPV